MSNIAQDYICPNYNCGGCSCHLSPPCGHCTEHSNANIPMYEYNEIESKLRQLEKENQKLEAEKSSAEKVLISVGRDYGDVAEEITKLLKENSEWQGKHLKIEAENSEMRDILKDTEFGLEDCRVCYSNRYEGHDKNCRLSKILKGEK